MPLLSAKSATTPATGRACQLHEAPDSTIGPMTVQGRSGAHERLEGILYFITLVTPLQPGAAVAAGDCGFWTPDYVARKLASYWKARVPKLILCVDEARNCSEADVPPGALVVKFGRRVDPQAVPRAIGAARQGLAT